MLRWILAITIGLALGLYLTLRPVAAQTGSPDQVSGELLYTISLEQTQSMLAELGFAILDKPEPLQWLVRSPSGYTLALEFTDCFENRCGGLRVRAFWPLGDRPRALGAVRSYEQSVAIAHVNLVPSRQGMYVFVGRDIWMLPGRTAGNVAAQLMHTDILAGSMTEHLRAKDPGISAFWEQVTPK